MISKIKKTLMILIFGAILVAPAMTASSPVSANVDIQNRLCTGSDIGNPDVAGNCNNATSSGAGVQRAATNIVNLLSWVVGVISVIMIIFAGFRYITSGGASDKVTGAKNTLIYAVIGLVIVALAQFIVNFVLKQTMETTGF